MSQSCQPPWIRRLRPGPGSRCRRASRRPVPACAAASSTAPPTRAGCAWPTSTWRTSTEVLTTAGRFVWIGLYEPNEELLREVQREFDLHDLAIEDAHNAHQRPKFERLRRFALRRPAHGADERRAAALAFGETHVFVGKNYVVSVRHGSLLSHVGLRTRCEATPRPALARARVRPLRADGLHRRSILPDRRGARGRARRRSRTRSSATTSAATPPPASTSLKRDLLALKRAVSPLVDVCNRLTRFDVDLIPEDTRPVLPRRLRSRHPHQRDDRQPARAADHRARGQPVADHGRAERGHQAPRRLGRDHRHADHDRRRSTA